MVCGCCWQKSVAVSTVTCFRTAISPRLSRWCNLATGAMATARRDEPLLDLEEEDEPNPFLSPTPPDVNPVLQAPPVPPRSNSGASGNVGGASVAEGAAAAVPPSHSSASSSSRVAAGSNSSSRPHNGNPFARELEEERARLNVSKLLQTAATCCCDTALTLSPNVWC